MTLAVRSDTDTTNTTNNDRFANAIPANETPIEAPILRATFRKLPLGIQLDYAQYHDLPNADALTSDEICASLFKERDSIPALEVQGHIQYLTREGLVVVKDVMDLVDWLVEHTSGEVMRLQTPDEDISEGDVIAVPAQQDRDTIPLDVQDSLRPTTQNVVDGNLEKMVEELELAHLRVNAAIEESRMITREACADVFILQGQIAQANAYHTEIVKTFTNIVGLEVMQEIADMMDVATREGNLPSETHQVEKIHPRVSIGNATKEPGTTVSPSYHVIAETQRTPDENAAPGPSSLQGTCSKVSRHSLGLKRNREDVDDQEVVDTGSSLVSQQNDSAHRRQKKARLGELSTVVSTTPALTISNYPCDEDKEADSSYSDSNGSERDFLDDPYAYYDHRGLPPNSELWPSDRFKGSGDEASQSETEPTNLWNTFDDEDRNSDPDYQAPDWDLEDIFELEHDTSRYPGHPLFKFKYFDELFDCDGAMSDGGLSTDDSAKGMFTEEMFQRQAPSRFHYDAGTSLGPLALPPRWNRFKHDKWGRLHDEETFTALQDSRIAERKKSKWAIIQQCVLKDPQWMELDVDKRLGELLTPDHSHYYFDNTEWKYFEEPSRWASLSQ